MTDNEIIKALECCLINAECDGCPMYDGKSHLENCETRLLRLCADLSIKRRSKTMFSRQDVIINTKIKDNEELIKLMQPICDFATKHDVSFDSGFDDKGNLIATYEAEGKTSAYCKGMVLEIKQMLKDAFNCKIDVLLYAY